MSLIICGDLHFREEQPFYNIAVKFIDWLSKQFNENDSLLLLGDVFDKSKPSALEYHLAIESFSKKLKFKKIYIIHGNHTWSRKYGSALEPLKLYKNIEIIYQPTILEIENKKCICLPFYPYSYKEEDKTIIQMKERYEKIHLEEGFDKADYIFAHLFYKEFFGDFIDISNIKGKLVCGHYHVQEENYLGTPFPQSYTEKDQIGHLLKIDDDKEEYIDVPKFLEYRDMKYGEKVSHLKEVEYIYTIKNAPSFKEAYSKYPNLHIRRIELESKEDESVHYESLDKVKSVREHLVDFLNEKKIKKSIGDILFSSLEKGKS